jgi:methionyl-tRNA formyltransferase
VPLRPGDTTGSLTESLAELGAELLVATLPRWLAGEIEPVAQDDSRATITRPVSKADAEIDWSEPAVTIWRKVRAYNPWPGAFTMAAGEILHIWNAAPIAGSPDGAAAGTVIPGDDGFAVQTGAGRLQVIEAQRAGRRRLPAAELLRGWPALAGMRLGGPPPEDR